MKTLIITLSLFSSLSAFASFEREAKLVSAHLETLPQVQALIAPFENRRGLQCAVTNETQVVAVATEESEEAELRYSADFNCRDTNGESQKVIHLEGKILRLVDPTKNPNDPNNLQSVVSILSTEVYTPQGEGN